MGITRPIPATPVQSLMVGEGKSYSGIATPGFSEIIPFNKNRKSEVILQAVGAISSILLVSVDGGVTFFKIIAAYTDTFTSEDGMIRLRGKNAISVSLANGPDGDWVAYEI